MEAAAMTRLLASADGGDAVALRRDLRLALSPALDADELHERAREAVACLRSPNARLAAVARALLTAPGEEDEGLTAGEWIVMEALAIHVSDTLAASLGGEAGGERETEEEEDALWEVLAALAQRSADEMGRGSRDKRWMQWCERSIHAVLAAQEKEQEKTLGRPSKGQMVAVRAVARALLSLHKTLAEKHGGHVVAFKLATLVWKNLTKLAKSYADMLFQGDTMTESSGEKVDAESSENAGAPLDAEDVVNTVAAAMEGTVGELLAIIQPGASDTSAAHGGSEGRQNTHMKAAPALRMLRLYWRAFQGHFLHLAASLSSSTLENCVLAIVNTASALIYGTVTRSSAGSDHPYLLPPKLAHDARLVLELMMSFPSKIASIHEATPPYLPETGLAIVQALLWYPAQDMVRAIIERQEQSESGEPTHSTARDASAMDISIRWSHWCLLVSMTAACRSNDTEVAQENDASVAELLDKLLDRCRDDCAIKSPGAVVTRVSPLVIDSLLELVVRFGDFEQLQLTLLKHAVHPCLDQRHLCWMLWKELLCYCWEEDTALAALETLFTLMEQESEDGKSSQPIGDNHQATTPLPSHVVGDIAQLVAFVYPEMPLSIKEACMQRVTSVIEHICSDGPYHTFSPAITARLSLFDQLASARFLRDYDHPGKEQWIATQLPMCFECCGTIIELLGPASADPDLRNDPGKFAGAMRVLDVCLLVLKSVYDDNDARKDTTDLEELSRILLPVMTEVLTLVATSARHPRVVGGGIGTANLSTARVLRACLYLLGKMSTLLKRNHSNQCVQVMKNLLDLISNDAAGSREWEQTTAGAVAWFVKTALFDVHAAEGDIQVVAELFTALFQRLCAIEETEMKSPLGQVILAAVYGVFAHSNVAQSINLQASVPIVTARQTLRQLALLHRDFGGNAGALASTATAFVSTSDARAQHARRCHRVFCQWFSRNTDELAEENNVGAYVSNEDQDVVQVAMEKKKRRVDKEGGEPSTMPTTSNKRQKLAHLVARCRQVIDNCGSTAENVSDQELDRAAKVLEDIIAKVLTF